MDELAARAAALAVRGSGDVRLRRVGVSRAGSPLWLLSVGRGARQVLVVAGPHANEPVGGATVLRLAERVLADPRFTVGADATWNLLLCLDPDGLRRNEGWLTAPTASAVTSVTSSGRASWNSPSGCPTARPPPRSRRPVRCSGSRTN